MGTGELRMIHSRVSWMFLPVERAITVSAPHRIDQIIFSTSSSMEEATAELPMLELILTRKLRPMIIGSLSGWLMLAGMVARPRATSSRTNSGVITEGMLAPHDWPGCWGTPPRCQCARHFAGLVFPDGNEFHFGCDNALPAIVDLGHVHAGFGSERLADVLKPQFVQFWIGCTCGH